MRLAHVIASTDVGACKPDPRIFAEAVRRAGVTASEILHVGDSWMWDVEGARGYGMGAALYRGLREHYWDSIDPREDPRRWIPRFPVSTISPKSGFCSAWRSRVARPLISGAR